jgi:Ca-activated chloride channel family protein
MNRPRLHKSRHSLRSRQGGMLVFVAILLPAILVLMAFAINLGWMDLVRTRTIIAADASTRAAGRMFAITGDLTQAKQKSREIAELNTIAGKEISISDSDFVLGRSSRVSTTGRYQFTAGGSNPNAMRVRIKRTNLSGNGAVDFLLPKTFDAEEFEFEKSAVSTRVDVDISFVVDRSGSMIYAANEKATGFPPAADPSWTVGAPAPPKSRWRDLADATNSFIKEIEDSALDERVSLVTYSDNAVLDRNLTASYPTIQTGVAKYTISFPTGATNIGAGLEVGVISLGSTGARDSASKVVILMTDGKLNAPPGAPNPITVAKKAAEKGVLIFTVTFADEADQVLMKSVATAGGGQHFHASTGANLTAILQTIARILPTVLTE